MSVLGWTEHSESGGYHVFENPSLDAPIVFDPTSPAYGADLRLQLSRWDVSWSDIDAAIATAAPTTPYASVIDF